MQPFSASKPLPSDPPLVAAYESRFELYASRRRLSHRLELLHEWFPKQKTLIHDRAITVQHCRNSVRKAMQAISRGKPAATLVQSLQLARASHTEFVRSVIEYNRAIAEYALSVKPYHTDPLQVAAMLIPVKSAPQNFSTGSATRQATLPDAFRGSGFPQSGGFEQPPAATQPPSVDRSELSSSPGNFVTPSSSPGGFQPRSTPGQPNGRFRR